MNHNTLKNKVKKYWINSARYDWYEARKKGIFLKSRGIMAYTIPNLSVAALQIEKTRMMNR